MGFTQGIIWCKRCNVYHRNEGAWSWMDFKIHEETPGPVLLKLTKFLKAPTEKAS